MAAEHTSAALKAYDVADAYEIYSLLLPHEESYGFAKDTLMIGEETESSFEIVHGCLIPAAASKFKDAIVSYNRVHREKRLLLRRFRIEKSYRLVSSDVIKALPDHPQGSVAYVVMSPVGFNQGKTRAIVYMSSSCGSLCGSARFHLLEKVNDVWKEVPGDICPVAS
jgi:hypothetical protein